MAHAATATHDYAPEAAAPREFSAFLRLRQGGAARATWLLTEAPGGTMIAVGTDAACDWQIRAAFVPPRAFSVLVVGGRAFVRSGPEPGLLVDGKPVDDSWNPLPAHARIDVGLARFEVRTGYSDEVTDEPVLDLGAPRPKARNDVQVGAWSQPAAAPAPAVTRQPVARVVSPEAVASTAVVHRQDEAPRQPAARRKRTMETQEYGGARREASRVQRVGMPQHAQRLVQQAQRLVTPKASAKPKAMRNSTIELNMDDLDYVGTIPMPGRGNERDYAVSPSLLGSDEITRVTSGSGMWRYVGMGAFFASAYGAWLYLLDRL